MFKNILQIVLIIFTSTLIYLGNSSLYSTSFFFLLLVLTLNKNKYSIISIIPLFFLNEILFFTFLIYYIILTYLGFIIKKDIYKRLSTLCISLIVLTFDFFILKNQFEIIKYSFFLLIIIVVIDEIKVADSEQIKLNILILILSLINLPVIQWYLFYIIYSAILSVEILMHKKSYYIFTSFLITLYSLAIFNNFIYIIINLTAYLGYLLKSNIYKSKRFDGLEFFLEDINTNITNFTMFLDDFNRNTNQTDYDKRVSIAIKILIENHCIACKNRITCYSNKKVKTYIYLKDILTKKEQINSSNNKNDIFECKYYFSMAEKALQLQKQYDLINKISIDDYKILGICTSMQNYFISIFDKVNPDFLKLINFKKELIDQNIIFNKFTYSIVSESDFSFKVYGDKTYHLLKVFDFAKVYFRKYDLQIVIQESYVLIHPTKKFVVIYDSATLSLNNCQISGDNMLFKVINEINFICALSDGMGSGYHAYQLSEQTLKMVDSITNCNIPFDASLHILNNFFKTKDLSDSFATLDLVNINLNTGILSLYKLGSSTTYISRGNKIIPIYNNNLPFGIDDLISKEEYQLLDGDLIILVSDGINDYIKESDLINYIEKIKNESPHKIVYEILQKIYYDNGNQINDDMSCIAIKINNKWLNFTYYSCFFIKYSH